MKEKKRSLTKCTIVNENENIEMFRPRSDGRTDERTNGRMDRQTDGLSADLKCQNDKDLKMQEIERLIEWNNAPTHRTNKCSLESLSFSFFPSDLFFVKRETFPSRLPLYCTFTRKQQQQKMYYYYYFSFKLLY